MNGYQWLKIQVLLNNNDNHTSVKEHQIITTIKTIIAYHLCTHLTRALELWDAQ